MNTKHKLCETCCKKLTGLQTKFCSIKCKNDNSNSKHQCYSKQQERGTSRRLGLIRLAGGKCRCGYDKNYAAMNFHHVDPNIKSFELDLRNCSNRNLEALHKELGKCILLCANCHIEEHNPKFSVKPNLLPTELQSVT